MEENSSLKNNTGRNHYNNNITFWRNNERQKNIDGKNHFVACLNKFQRKTWDMALQLLRKFIDSNPSEVSPKQKQMVEDFELKSKRIRESIENYSLKLKELKSNKFNLIQNKAEEYNGSKVDVYPLNIWKGARIKISREERFLFDRKNYFIGCLLNFKRKTWDMIVKDLKFFSVLPSFNPTENDIKLISDLEMKIENIRSNINFYSSKLPPRRKFKPNFFSMDPNLIIDEINLSEKVEN